MSVSDDDGCIYIYFYIRREFPTNKKANYSYPRMVGVLPNVEVVDRECASRPPPYVVVANIVFLSLLEKNHH